MKKKILLVAVVLVLSLVTVLGCTSQAGGGTSVTLPSGSVISLSGDNNAQSGIWVSGEGKVMAAPDLILLTLGVEAEELTVAIAQEKAVAAMDEIRKILLEQGIAEKDIQTSYYNISRVTRWIPEEYREEIIKYRVTNTVVVKIRQLDKAGSIIDAVALASGDLTRIDNISFTIEDPTSYYNEAREKAMQDAINKATQVAKLAGIALDKPTYIAVGSSYLPSPLRNYDVGYAKAEGAASVPTTYISSGELEIETTVSVTFAIK